MNARANLPSVTTGAAAEAWQVPVEIVLACTGSSLKAVVLKRFARGDYPKPAAKVISRGEKFFATIEFQGDGRPAIFLPLDVWTLEARR